MALSFETSQAVDDIRCELADGTAIVLQAKRACGADEQLQRTVSQWVRHVPDLKTGEGAEATIDQLLVALLTGGLA